MQWKMKEPLIRLLKVGKHEISLNRLRAQVDWSTVNLVRWGFLNGCAV